MMMEMEMIMKMKMKTRGEEEGEGDRTDMDHNRLPVPRSKQALSRRLQAQHPRKKLAQLLDSLVRVSRRVERD